MPIVEIWLPPVSLSPVRSVPPTSPRPTMLRCIGLDARRGLLPKQSFQFG